MPGRHPSLPISMPWVPTHEWWHTGLLRRPGAQVADMLMQVDGFDSGVTMRRRLGIGDGRVASCK